ncbi:MAG: hypothetical protein COS89_04430, partial [Deltaproteobacteria bacterium CG07_land_8_20_14_0_80_38_7]
MFFTGESGSQPPGRGNGSGRIPVFLAGPSDDGSGRRVGGSLTVRSSDQSTQLEEADAREAARLARVEGVDLQSSLAARFAGPRYVLTNFVLFNANSGAKVLGINVNPDSDISLSNMVYFKIDDPKNQLTPERVYQNYGTEGGQLRFYNDFVAGRITPIILNERLQDDSTPESFSNLERGWLNIYVNQENPPTHDAPLPLRINADDVYGLNADIRLVADIHTNAAMLDLIDIEAEPHLMPIRDAGNHIGSLIQIGARRITPELAEMLCQIRGNVTNVVAVIQGRWPSTTPASNINFNGDLSQVEFLLNRGDPILSESDQGAEHVIDVSDVRLNFFGFSNIQEFAFYSEAARHVIANNRTLEAAVEAISTGDEDPLSVVAAMPGVEEVAVEDDFNSLDTNERFIAVVVSETDDPDFPESEVFTPVQYRERCEERALSENEAIHFFRFTQSKGYESLRTSVRTSFSAEAGTFIRRDIRTRVSGDNLNDDGVYQDRMRNVRERGYRQVEPDVARIISEARGLRDTDWGVAVIHGSDHRVMVSAAAVDYARISPCDVIEFYVNGDEPFFRRVAGNVDVVGLDHLNRPLQIPYEMSALEAETYARAGALFWEESQSLNTLFMMVNDARLVDGLQFIASQPCFRLISSDPEEFLASPAADRPWVGVVVTNDWRSGIFPKAPLQESLREQGPFSRESFSRFGFRGVHFFEIDE